MAKINDSVNVEFDQPKLKLFKAAYAKAVEAKQDSFWFEGHEFLTSYAKYVIEYLEGLFKGKTP
jgi:hypothetical protein